MPDFSIRTATDVQMMLARERFAAVPASSFGLSRMAYRISRWLCGLGLGVAGLLFVAAPAAAQTPVSGALAVDTHWTLAGAPYLVSGDVVVQNGAVLTIDPGVTVSMDANASLTVQGGGIKASGTAAQPIQVLSDKVRLAQAPAPGDWKQWIFNPGTVNTRLDYVNFEHGKGLVVKGSAPVFNFLNLRNHQGAAITVDLAASPSGVGNQASGNTLNGIAVPAGDIAGSVKWGLRGIPYVVASGVVSVGASPTVNSVTPNVVQQGQTVTVLVTGSRLAGLSSARFDTAGLNAQILAGATDTQASLSITADASAVAGATAALRMLTNAGEVRLANAITLAQVQPTLTSVTPSTIYLGQGTVELILNGRDFTSQTVVLVNAAPLSTQFVSTTQLRTNVTAPATSGNLSVRLRTPDTLHAGQFLTSNELLLPAVAAQLALTPSTASFAKGASRTFTVATPYRAPAGGLTLTLVSSIPSVASVPLSIVVPEGQSSASFQVLAVDIGNTVVTASKVGFASAQASISVVPPPSLTFNPASLTLGVGRTAELTVQSSVPAAAGGLTVTLASSAPQAATVPASVTIAAGASSATVPVSTVAIGTTTITAQASEFVNGSAAVNVRPVSLNLPSGALVAPGLSRSIPITLSDPAPAGGLLVTLVSSNPAAATVPASVTVPAGQSNINFTLNGVAVGTASISATASNYQAGTLPVTVDAVSISLGSPAVSSISVAEMNSLTFAVTLSRPAPTGGVVVNLVTADPSKAAVAPASVTIAEGQTSGGVVQVTVSGVLKGSTTLSASAAGLNPANIPVTITGKPQIVFSTGSVTVGKGLKTYVSEVYLYRRTDGNGYAPNQQLTVNLSTSDAAKASVPATVTIPANQSSVNFYVTGVDLTNGAPVTIDAVATSYTAPPTKLAASVVAPTFTFQSLDTTRSSASARDNFYISANTPGAAYSGSQSAVADLPINLSIVEGNPANIVDGFYSAVTGGTPITQLILRKDYTETYSGGTGYSYVGTPTSAGTYKVQATAAGVASVTSGVVTVTAPELKFSVGSVTVGKGLKTYSQEVYLYRAVGGAAFTGAEALTVNLSSSDAAKASVPATVTIPANQSTVYFYVTGVDLTNGTPVTIDAVATGYTAPATKLAANVVAPTFTFQSLDTTRSSASARDNFYISANTPGAAYSGSQSAVADLPINLSIVEGNPANIVDGFYSAVTGGTPITQLILRKDNTETYSGGTGYSYVGTPTSAGSYKVQASATGVGSSTSGVVTVTAPELKFSVGSVTVGKGLKTYSQEVYLYRAVGGAAFTGAEALTVNLSSSDAAKASVPATATIPANQSGVYFYVTGVNLTSGTPVTIDAVVTGYTSPTTKLAANVVAPTFTFQSLDTSRSPASPRDNFYIQANTPGAAYSGSQTAVADLPIDLSIVEGNPANIVDGFYSAVTGGIPITQVILRKDNSETYSGGTGYIYVGIPTAAGSYKVRASASGVGSGTSVVMTVTAPELKFSLGSVTVGKGMKTYSQEVYVYRAANGTVFNGPDAVTVNLACSSTAICTVPVSVTIPAGQSSAYFQVNGISLGNTTVTVSAVGYSATQDLGVNVVTPQLAFSGPSNTTVGAQPIFTFYLKVPGANYNDSQTALSPFAISLTSSAPGVATVPATTTVQTGNTYSDVNKLTGVAPGTTTITASGAGLSSATSGVITITQ